MFAFLVATKVDWNIVKIIITIVGSGGGFGVIFGGIKYIIKLIRNHCKSKKLKESVNQSGDWVENYLHKEHFQSINILYGKKCIAYNRMKDSFVLHGNAGSGKSMILRKHYLVTRKREKKASCYFYSADQMNEANFFDTIQAIRNNLDEKMSKVIFYFDGIDETINANKQFFYKIRDTFNTVNLKIRISCRDNFFIQLTNSELQKEIGLFNHFYATKKWSRKELIKFLLACVNAVNLSKTTKKHLEHIFKSISDADLNKLNYNPLMCKMLCNIFIHKNDYQIESNRYAFYESFFRNAVLVNNPFPDKHLSRFAKEVFLAYSKKSNVNYDSAFELILKSIGKDNIVATFKHETFKEFLLAYYYVECLKDQKDSAVDVLSCAYPNDIADYISAGLLLYGNDQIVEKLKNIYLHTRNEFDDLLQSELKSLVPEKHFRLKYEIIFRLGRLQYSSSDRKIEIISFLEDIYYNDNDLSKLFSDNQNYWVTVLKRCCAISASFLGGYTIEMDYVAKMLDWKSEYDKNFDLANRSHTLYFYGDIMNDDDIFEYIDNDANCSCDKALHKRINRLSKINGISDTSSMNATELRTYYFRLFDIATIYTFIKSRTQRTWLLNLSVADKKVIEEFKTDFEDAGDKNRDRAVLLLEIKNATVELLSAM